MEEDLKKILTIMIGMSMQGDCEMVNMGDWSVQDLDDISLKKIECIENLKDPLSNLNTVPSEIIYQAVHDFALYMRTFGPDDGMETMQKVEHILSKHIWRNFHSNISETK